MPRVVIIAALAMLAACPGEGDDGDDIDAMVAHGLLVHWTTDPSVPGAISAGLNVSGVELNVSSLRVVGDAAPGDTRTTASGLQLLWESGQEPAPTAFPDAPAGLYARIELGTGGSDEHYELRGTVELGGGTFRFEIEDESPLSISLPVEIQVTGGPPAEVTVLFDAGAVLAAVPFDQIPPDGEEIHIEAGDPEIAGIRASMASAFRIAP